MGSKNLPLKVISYVDSNKVKHHILGSFDVLARHGATCTIDLSISMATHPTFNAGRLKRYHDSQVSSPVEKPGENSPPQIEDESRGKNEQQVSEPVNGKQKGDGTHVNHAQASTKFRVGGSQNSMVNTPVELPSLTTKSDTHLDEGHQGPQTCWLG
ncbi:Pol protein [Phytophthora palmivora]|uniref:Pol protein n=1 Tax=Phytophthora palmivora TaxID=4796 RepID=A0A2P4XQR4_9STRA|nr:Pol protein [Phytophthora palmivora]